MRTILPLVTALLLASSPALADDKKFSMEDLQALARQGSWIELSNHLLDIAPSKRDKAWDKLVEDTAVNLLRGEATKDDPLMQVVYADAFTKQFPKLKKSKTFMAERAKAGLAGFEECYSNQYQAQFCTEKFVPFVEADKGNVKLAIKAGEIVTRGHHPTAAFPMFEMAVKWGGAKKACTADRLDDALTYTLALPDSHKKVERSRAMAKTCFKAVRKRLVDDYINDSNSYYRNAVCPILKANKALSKKELARSDCGAK